MFGMLFKCFYFSIYLRDSLFFGLKEAIGIEQIIDGRHKVRMVIATGQYTGKGGNETNFTLLIFHHQHTEHLAHSQFIVPSDLLG